LVTLFNLNGPQHAGVGADTEYDQDGKEEEERKKAQLTLIKHAQLSDSRTVSFAPCPLDTSINILFNKTAAG